ncbi:GNAT family N-acetyltransferase [Streptomyces sp. NPDC051162]|uniref:GNAT family N-acetyltransferase n=1 Tax=Streptomyces sp. NPDC051162 TaxID=3154747 RepID=UPI00341613D4
MTEVRLSRRGEGHAVADLARLALSHLPEEPHQKTGDLAETVNELGGRFSLTYGHGHCFTAHDGQSVVGMAYMAPLIQWIEMRPERVRTKLARALAELELLAVMEGHRKQGVGDSLLKAVEEQAKANGTRLLVAKVPAGDRKLQLWYRRRGYTIAAPKESIIFRTAAGLDGFSPEDDRHQLVVKALQAGDTVRRESANGESALVAQQA